jgi:hypothetical protein
LIIINPLTLKTAKLRASGLTSKSKFRGTYFKFLIPTITMLHFHYAPTRGTSGRSMGVSNRMMFFLLLSRDFRFCFLLILSVWETVGVQSQKSAHSSPHEQHGKTRIYLPKKKFVMDPWSVVDMINSKAMTM